MGASNRRARRIIVLALPLLGAALLLVSLFLGWYTSEITATTGGGYTNIETLNPMWVASSESTQGQSFSKLIGYPAANLPHTGQLYADVTLVVGLGALLGLAAGFFGVLGKGVRFRAIVFATALAASGLAVAAPTALYLEQPTTICSEPQMTWNGPPPVGNQSAPTPTCGWGQPCDTQGCWTGASGPPGQESSFFGSDTSVRDHTWGPSIGWYLSFLAAVVLAGGALVAVYPLRPTGPRQG